METINYSEAYKSFLNFVHLIESDETSYTIIFEKEGNPFSVDAKFKMTEEGNYELSFSTKEVIPSKTFYNSLTVIQSEWYNIVFENMHNEQVQTKISNSGNPIEYRIMTKSFRTSIEDNWENSYICAFYKYNHNIFNPDKSCILGINHEPIEVKIQGYELIIYWGEKTSLLGSCQDERYLMFFSWTKMDLSTFKKVINAVRVVWGLISGYYIGKNVYYMSCKPEDSCDGISLAYINLQEEIVSYRGLLTTGTCGNVADNETHLTIKEFECFVNLLYRNNSFFRAGQLLVNASNDIDLSKGGIAAIALETITGEIWNNMEHKDVKMPKELHNKIRDCIIQFYSVDKISKEKKEHYINKMSGFSEHFNSEKLLKPFEHLGIMLNRTEVEIVKNRNRILHGELPRIDKNKGFDFATKLSGEEIIFYASNKMIMLCVMLLLRMADKDIDKQINDWGVTIIVIKRLMAKGKYNGNSGAKFRRLSDINSAEDSIEWLV